MKSLQSFREAYKPNPKAEGEQKFIKKHVTVKKDDANGNKDDVFNADNVKTVDRNKDDHGYNPGQDEAVYEAKVDPLTPSEKSEKEKIVKGMKKNMSSFKNKYGKSAEAVMHATATKMANESVEMNENMKTRADKNYAFHSSEAHHYLKKIGEALAAHEEKAKSAKGYYSSNDGINWGHAGDVEHVHKTLRDLHSMISPKSVSESAGDPDMDEEDFALDDLLTEFFFMLNEDEREVVEAIFDAGDEEALEEFIADYFDIVFEGRDWEADEWHAAIADKTAGKPSASSASRVQHHLVRDGKKLSSHGTESQAMSAFKKLDNTKGVKIVRESVEEYELDEEQLDELSAGTLSSYMKKSKKEMSKNLSAGDPPKGSSREKLVNKRASGYRAAWAKKEAMGEEVVSIDEISKETASSYLKKKLDKPETSNPKTKGEARRDFKSIVRAGLRARKE